MKKLMILGALVALSAGSVSAQTLFSSTFSSGSTPTGFTAVTNSSGTISYAGSELTVGDIGVNGAEAYLTDTSSAGEGATSISTSFTFTPTYTVGTGHQANTTLLSLYTNFGNNAFLSIDFQPVNYGAAQVDLNIGGGIGYGGGDSTGTTSNAYYTSPTGSLSGVALTFNLVTTFSDSMGTATDTTTGTLSDSSGVLENFYVVRSGSDSGGAFNPSANPITVEVGDALPVTYGTGDDNDGILNTGSTVSFSNLDVFVTPIPEPSTVALMLGGLVALALIARRRLVA